MRGRLLGPPVAAARGVGRTLGVRRLATRLEDRLPRRLHTRPYASFDLVYTRGNSLVHRIEHWGPYEPELVEAVCTAVAASPSQTLVDVGANIGLISLAVLERVPDARIFAFEPGPHQRRLLLETVRRNRLADRLSVSGSALSDSEGTATFAVHAARHAAGDGLRDTRRAGAARRITVETETLDCWWERAGRPALGVVKLDTEGSELLILRGARAVLAACRPVVFLEIHDRNLEAYPYGADDVHAFLAEAGYALTELGPTEFVARPT